MRNFKARALQNSAVLCSLLVRKIMFSNFVTEVVQKFTLANAFCECRKSQEKKKKASQWNR